MHIPDPFLSTPVWASLAAASALGVSVAARRASASLDERRVPLLGVMGAFVFAAQMVNFPVGIGTSGHLVGASLLALTLGPAAATVVMTAIVAVQALVFGDGGLLALGANIFNMAIAGVALGYLPYALLHASGPAARTIATFLGGFLSVAAGATLALTELWLSGNAMPNALLGVSVGLFAAAAVAEGIITVLALRAIEAANPQSIHQPQANRGVVAVAIAAVVIVGLGVVIASAAPDTLEAFAQRAGFAHLARATHTTPFTGYETAFLAGAWWRQVSAGIVGLALVFVLVASSARLLGKRQP